VDIGDDSPVFSADAKIEDDQVTVLVTGEVDLSTADALFQTATRYDVVRVVLDLQQVTFFDSAAIRTVVRLAARYNGGLTVLPSERVRRVLEISGLLDQPWVRPT
jgi:stage II sporulation protein AA (anti-sigma F factor antagonist)